MTATNKPSQYRWSEHQHLYNSTQWRKLRQAHLMSNPLCVMCQQLDWIEAATVVDHVTPHRGDRELFFNSPLQSLCAMHHNSTKARIERSGVQIGGDVNGQPIDNNSHWYR
jgi:5-methylcytosine-specific restriction endonuclease McrA